MDSLLAPISAETPCGVDLSYESVYNDLAVLMEGTPENQFEPGSAKEPDWRDIQKTAEEALGRSKDLQITIYLTVALSQISGMAGAARGLELIAGLVRTYWDTLFPNLDPEDKDPTQRVNILSQLTVEKGSFGDPVKFIERMGKAPIFQVPGLAVTIDLLTGEAAAGKISIASRLPEIIASGNAEDIQAGIDAFRRSVAAVHALDDFLIATVGREAAPSFDPLIKVLDKGLRMLDGSSATVASEPGAGATTAAAAKTSSFGGARSGGPGISGEIQSFDDVRRMLEKIREFYAAAEPASPVPMLLLRAERLVGKTFAELIENLTPSARGEFEVLLGPQPE